MVTIYYDRHIRTKGSSISGHVIRASSKKEALKIAIDFGISNPRFANDIMNRLVRLLDQRKNYVKGILQKRRLKIGGSVWYVEDGILKEETNG